MSYGQMIDAVNRKGDLTVAQGKVKGDMYHDIGNVLSSAFDKKTGMNFQTSERQGSEAATAARQTQDEQFRSGETQKARDVERTDANAYQDAVASMRSTAADQGQAAIDATNARDVTSDAWGTPNAPKPAASSGSPGPTSPAIMKRGGFQTVAAAEAAARMQWEDEGRRRGWQNQDADFAATGRAFDALPGAEPRNPMGGVAGADLAGAARSGSFNEVAHAAGAMRQGSYEDPQNEETLARNRGFEDVSRPLALAGASANILNTLSEAGHRNAEATSLLHPQARPHSMTPSEVNQLLATSTGRQHEELKALYKRQGEAKKALMNAYGDDGSRQAAQTELTTVETRMSEIKQEIDAIQAQWFKQLSGPYPQIGGGGTHSNGIDPSAIDAELAKRNVLPPAGAGQ